MNRLLDSTRTYVLSPEFVAVLAIIVVNLFWPSFFDSLGRAVKGSAAGIEAGLFFAILGPALLVYKWSDDILNPADKAVLTGWPEYWRLKSRVWASFVLCGFATVLWMVGILAIAMGSAPRWGAVGLVAGGVVALICSVTVAVARLMIKEVLAGQ